jgi:hypothetical protein
LEISQRFVNHPDVEKSPNLVMNELDFFIADLSFSSITTEIWKWLRSTRNILLDFRRKIRESVLAEQISQQIKTRDENA